MAKASEIQQIAGWLGKLGMSEYAQRFAENGISAAALRYLTDQDLKDMGVLLGHRRIMLAAISELGSPATETRMGAARIEPKPRDTIEHVEQAPNLLPSSASPAREATGERRYLTVLFCDLVGSTGLSAQLDAEDWRDLVGVYVDTASAAVTEMGGHVAKKLGDGLMALFGYPAAQENDAERAARAALSIQRALAEVNRKNTGSGKPALSARIGIETGPVVVDAAGEIYGDAPNIAARVQALAEPGTVLVTAGVQRQVAGLFVAEERGIHELKGVPEPVTLFRLVRASGGGRRAGQRHLTPLVGREEEIAMLIRRWERARQGDGQLVMIVGEPGLGKSRLIEELHARLGEMPHTWVEWSCSQLLQNTPLHPIAEWGRQRFGGADVPAAQRLAELESSLAQVKLDPAESISLLAPLLDIPLPPERAPSFAPEELRRQQLAALTNWVIAGAKSQPLVLAFEDLHWADPTTLDVLRGIAERGALAPLLVVATTRPEFRPPWGMRSHHGTISLAPLDRGQVQEMVAELSARHALPRNVVEDVASRTGGVPLFVEEVTRLLLERGEGGGGIQAIPATLQQSLMARLDRLGPAREVAQIGAVIGRGFSYKLLQAVAGMDDAPLEAALEKLSEADIVLVDGVLPESDYRFKHALIQDAAYENLLKSRRQVLHRRIAETLRDYFADKAAAEPEVLAHHFTQAGLTDAAIEWWGKAGDQALRRSAFQEAISHLGKAIDMADKTAEAAPHAAAAPVSADQRVKLQTNYGQALTWGKGYAAPETAAAFARARDLGANAGDATARFETYYGQWAGSFMRGDYASCRDTAAAFLHDAEGAARMPEIAAAHRVIGLTLHLQGDFVDARPHFVEALRIYDPQWDHDTKIHIGHDTGACATAYLARVNWVLGELGQTRELMDDALARAVESGHVPTLANTHYHKTLFELQRGNTEAAWRDAERVLQLGRQHELPTYLAFGSMSRGYARACLGERDAGIAELRDGLTAYIEQGNKVWVPYYQALLASLEGEGRDAEGPLRRIDEALGLAGATSEHENDALLHHIRGEIILKLDPANTAPAEEAFLTAIAIAQQQKARSFELRAALALAKLYQSSNRTADAHAVLAPALEGFSATPEFPEIKEAQALLAAFSDTDEVKSATASRHHRLQLQVSLGNALIAARGHQSLETAAAFARARELAVGIEDAPERFSALFGVWLGGITRAELAPAREAAEALLREAKRRPQSAEAGAAHRVFAVTSSVQGNFVDARKHFEQALAILESTPDGELGFRFGDDPAVAAMIRLAQAIWALGEADLARLHADRAVSQATQGGHVPSICYAYGWKAAFEAMRHDVGRARADAERVIALSTQHSLPMWLAVGTVVYRWARCRLGDKGFGAAEIRDSNKVLDEMGLRLMQPLFAALIAEAEANEDRIEASLAVLECELVETKRTGFCWHDAELHRIRGEVLLKRDPANPAPAEESFLTAIAIAKRQQARSFELRAALPLAKLYQSMGRPADAHAVLAPALEGFSPTPEFLEIEQARSLLDASAS